MRSVLLAGCLVLFLLSVPLFSRADSDQDIARNAMRAGEILPLEKILLQVRKAFPGEVLEVELERKGTAWVYDIKLLQDSGQLLKLRYNASTAALLENRSKPGQRGRHGFRRGHEDDS